MRTALPRHKEVIVTSGTTTANAQVHSIRPELVPDHIRDDFCGFLAKGFLKAIEDPDYLRHCNEQGRRKLAELEAKAGQQ